MNLQPFVVFCAQTILFYSSSGADIIIHNDKEFMIPFICWCTVYSLQHRFGVTDAETEILNNLLIYFILPSTMIVLYECGFDTTLLQNTDLAAILWVWKKIFFF